MIIQEGVKDLEIIGEHNSKKATISDNKLAKLQYLLTKGLYKDPITAVIAEWANNGVDSVVQAGKSPIEHPVMVCINKSDKGQFVFSVEDKGTGLDDRDFTDVCMNYLESTKEGDNDTIGHFGIGMKSFLSLERSATFTCRKNGIERKYLVYEGSEFVNFDLIYEKVTDEENGVIAELVIKDWNERLLFMDKAKSKLAYYDTVILVIDGMAVGNDIHRNELFQWSSLNKNNYIHIALKDVYYTIDYEALGISPIALPIAIRLQLGDGLTPTPSRESYITNDKVRALIMQKIKEIAEWFVNKYNETVKEFPNLIDAFDYLGNNDYKVTVHSKEFTINQIANYTKVGLLQPQIKGLKQKDGLWYKSRSKYLLQQYNLAGYVQTTGKVVSKEKKVNTHFQIYSKKRVPILIACNFTGNVREFLKRKYGKEQIYLKKNLFTRHLGGKEDNRKNVGNSTPDSYYNILDLRNEKRKDYRLLIDEWNFVVSTVVSTFKDETKLETSKEYIDWIDQKKANQKMRKAAGYISPTYTGLNKQKGDVTISYSYERYDRIYFKKDVYPISNLVGNQFLTVFVEDDEIEMAKQVISIAKNENVKFATIGKLERKRIPDNHQFITFKQYLSMDSKPFMRLASSILFKRVVDEFTKLTQHKNGVFKLCVNDLVTDIEILDEYQQENFLDCGKKGAETLILQVADEKNLYDTRLWDVYQRVRAGMKKYDFVNLFKEPDYYDSETKKRYDSLIRQILLFRKKEYDDLEGAEIVFKTKK